MGLYPLAACRRRTQNLEASLVQTWWLRLYQGIQPAEAEPKTWKHH